MKVLVTGGAGFIGSAVCRLLIGEQNAAVLNVDKLTYAANLMSLRTIENNPRYAFRQADICDRQAMCGLMEDFDPMPFSIWLPNRMSTARSMVPWNLPRPMSRVPACC
jgi:dTDP-D-glucose 4,6-dehydratase